MQTQQNGSKSDPVNKNVTDAASEVSPAGIHGVRIYRNMGANTVYIGATNQITAAGEKQGYPIPADGEFTDYSQNATWAICAAGLNATLKIFSIGR